MIHMACCEIPELDGMIIYRWGSNRKIIHKWSLRGKSSMNGILSGKSSTKRYHWTIGLGIFQQAMFDCHRVNIHQNDPYWFFPGMFRRGNVLCNFAAQVGISHYKWRLSLWKAQKGRRYWEICGDMPIILSWRLLKKREVKRSPENDIGMLTFH